MSRILVIGATGGIGRRLCPLLVAAGHDVTGVHRKPEQAQALADQGLTPVAADMMTVTADLLVPLILGHDAVVFSAGAAGSGAGRTAQIDGEGPGIVSAAMERAGLRRLYLVSAFPEAGRDKDLGAGFEHYMRMKKQAEAALVRTPLDWLILRPGTLTDAPGSGRVALGPALSYGAVPRDDVAAVLAGLVERPGLRREILELRAGDVPVAEALAGLEPR